MNLSVKVTLLPTAYAAACHEKLIESVAKMQLDSATKAD
jgi:hypothetical protein